MNEAKHIKIAVIVSQAVLVIWLILTVLSYAFQSEVIDSLFDGTGGGGYPKVFLYSHIVQFAAFITATAANISILINKGKYAPLLAISVSAAVVPVMNIVLYNWQGRSIADAWDGYTIDYAVLSAFYSVNTQLLYILYMGAVITVAASAVYGYSKRKSTE